MLLVPRCSICQHEATAEINRGLSAGIPYRTLAAQYGVSPSALSRHTKHIDRQRQLRETEQELKHQDVILEKLELLDHRLDRLFQAGLEHHSVNTSLGCIRESLRLISILERVRQPVASVSGHRCGTVRR
jgi:hypothetical protein